MYLRIERQFLIPVLNFRLVFIFVVIDEAVTLFPNSVLKL